MDILRYAAFTNDPAGGNPAGVVLDATGASDAQMLATATEVGFSETDLADDILTELLAALRWQRAQLDPALPPRVAFAGAWHPVIAASSRARLAALDYDFDALAAVMNTHNWTTVDLIWRQSRTVFHAGNPFPPGGVVEDPVTGAAAAFFARRPARAAPLRATRNDHHPPRRRSGQTRCHHRRCPGRWRDRSIGHRGPDPVLTPEQQHAAVNGEFLDTDMQTHRIVTLTSIDPAQPDGLDSGSGLLRAGGH